MFDTAVLFITFNRPEHTRKVFESIKAIKPTILYVFQDGCRANNLQDIKNCQEVRDIFSGSIDWDCELNTYYSSQNLGCGKGPATAITWFFENVEQGIIIEDDAIASPDFFVYAEELLEKYKNADSIKVIGSMHLDDVVYGAGSYHFSMANRNLCAWASWRRVWQAFDYRMTTTTQKELKKVLKHYKCTIKEIDYWSERLDEIHKDGLKDSSWDMQFLMSIWLSKGIGIFPNVNLSTNIGFDSQATHTASSDSAAANKAVQPILPIVHPPEIELSRQADLNYHKLYFQPHEYGINGLKRWPHRINKKIKRRLGIKGSWIKK